MALFDDFSFPSTGMQRDNEAPEIQILLNKLEGYKTRVKNMHWSAKFLPYRETQELHEDLDDVLSLISDYQDTIAENYMGLFGNLPLGFLNGVQPDSNDPLEVIDDIITTLRNFHSMHRDNVAYTGMVNATEDLLEQLPVKKYLIQLCR